MCGIICYFGHTQGTNHILNALKLLEYRAPDSSGLAVINGNVFYSLRRSVGTVDQLIEKIATNPICQPEKIDFGIERLFNKQGLDIPLSKLRDCSFGRGYRVEDIYNSRGLQIGIGDRGSCDIELYDLDPVRHAFDLVGER